MHDATRYAPIGPDHTLTGEFRMHLNFRSRFLPDHRNVLIYLPPGYDDQSPRRYPVLYLHDGQNLFDGATAYVKGQDWGVDETVESMIVSGRIEPLIIVGIYNTGESRVEEYTPSPDPRYDLGGKLDLYGRLIAEDLKPFIDRRYRTRTGPLHTALGGSSLGGLATLYLGLKFPTIFSRLIVMSPSVWWDRGVILREVKALRVKPSLRIWLDVGTKEGKHTARQVRALRDALVERGWRLGDDLKYFEARGALHNERAWGERIGPALRFIFPS
ncbi:MAG: alpha/beta hydrolase [Acidobacteria bacterium]|nr:alpha/beta hydrolase [Acidobacteriota bacterium]MCW5971470.1 alpha/beta hydrolase [Blastocatellales bacterium]